MTTRLSWLAVLPAVLLAACGGEGDGGVDPGGNPASDPGPTGEAPAQPVPSDPVLVTTILDPGGVTTVVATPLDPFVAPTVVDPSGITSAIAIPPPVTTLPAGYVLRESFGGGVGSERPSGNKGTPKSTLFGNIDGFWAEYPGTADVRWSAAEQGWAFAGCSADPYEAPSALQPYNGCVVSSWRDDILAFPDAIVPFSGLGVPYVVSADVYPGVLAGAYVAVGLSGSPALTANLATSGLLWILLRQGPAMNGLWCEWELRSGPSTVLASGTMPLLGYNPVALRYDPVEGRVSATVNGLWVGTFAAPGVTPSHVVLEGQGWIDNLVVYPAP